MSSETCQDCGRPIIRRLLTPDEMRAHSSGARKVCVCGFRRFVEKIVDDHKKGKSKDAVWPGYEREVQ